MTNNFGKKLEEATDDELYLWVNTLSPTFTILASNELIKRTLTKLQKTIEIFNKQSSEQADKMIFLTWVIVGLTVAMLIGLVVQICLSLK